MKSNQSSKNFKSVARVLTIVICIALAISLVTVQQTEAVIGIAVALVAVFAGGLIIGWLANSRHDSTSPDALITSQENYVTVWNDFIEDWNNDYTDENVDLANYMMMFNLTFLDSVRRAEHDVASYVHLLNWSDVENNMSSLIGYKENVTNFIISTLHGYNRIDISILQHIYDTDTWSYTTPMKHAKTVKLNSAVYYDWCELTTTYRGYNFYTQYKANFGSYPVGYDGEYDIGDKFYVTFIYVPNGEHITLKDLVTNIETTYYHGVYDLEGKQNEVINVTTYDYGVGTNNHLLDVTGVYLFGLPTDFDMLEDNFITYGTDLTFSSQPQSVLFENDKFITEFTVKFASEVGGGYGSKVYVDGDYIGESTDGSTANPTFITYTTDDYIHNITTTPFWAIGGWATSCVISIQTEGYIYHDMTGGLRVDTDSAGTANITDNLLARGRIGLDWMVDSYKNIYDGMIINAKILWNLYHGNGWYSTDDIPSEFLVVPPDIIFDNMDALTNLPLDKAQAIYYAWMAQIIDFYNENPDYVGTYDDTNMTVFDDGIIINASLIHGSKTVFENHEIYISPLLGDFEICKNNSYNLTQKIFIYDITATYIYYGYVGDNLTINSITIEDVETDCVTLGRQTMQDFLLGKYGFSISFPAEWVFPEIENLEIYMTLAIGCIVAGIIVAVASSGKFKKFRPIGYLLVAIGIGVIIWIYVIPIIQSFLSSLVFW